MARHVVLAVLVALAGPAFAKGAPGADAPGTSEVGAPAELKSVQRLAPPLGCDRLTIAEGLPNSQVHAIVQDKLGFVWFGTQDGLARYDGIRMRVYRPVEKDPTSLSATDITSLATDANGGVWVGTEAGLNLYDPKTDHFTRFVHGGKGGLSSEGVAAMARDAKGRMWFAMSGGGLDRFDPSTNTFTEFLTKPLDVSVTAITAAPNGTLWLGTSGDGVFGWNPDTNAVTRPAPSEGVGTAPITAITISADGKIWVGTDGDGVAMFDPAGGKVARYRSSATDPATISDDNITAVFEDKSKNIWIGTTNGLNQVSPTNRVVRFQHSPSDPSSLSFNGVQSVYQDAGGVIWVGGFTIGVCKFDELRLKFGYHRTQNNVTALFEDADHTLWAGTYNDGLYKYEHDSQRVTHYRELRKEPGGAGAAIKLESAAWIPAIYRDRRGTLWISVKGHGLVAFDTKTETYRDYVPDPDVPGANPVDAVFAITEDPRGMLWLATWGAGLVRFDPQQETFKSFTAADDANGISSNYLYTLYQDPAEKNVLWIGAGKGGLIRFDTSTSAASTFRHKDSDPASLSNDDVVTIYREAGGALWVGTFGGGLNHLDPTTGKAERFNKSNSDLPNDAVLGILPDDAGHLWLSTNGRGLVDFDPKAKKFFAYEASDGVQDNEFNQSSFLRSKTGQLFFGGPNGFNAFYPRDIKRDTYMPPVLPTAFKIFNEDVKLDRPIWTLPPLQVAYSDSFEIQFAALAFAAPQRNRYAYKLDGFDDKFIETDRPFVSYTKLGGGTYTLRIRSANRHGVWNEAAVMVKLSVTPPFWRTWRAFGFYVLVLAGLVYLLLRYQSQRLFRAEREGRLAVVERDLELTGAVQTGFLPENNTINTAHMQLVGLYRPADACGGDWWWHEPLSNGRHVIMVGDVTGHGPGPAMVTAAVATAFRVLIENGLDDVRHALELLNREVLRVAKGRYQMTMAALELDEGTGRWKLYSAGAPPILSLGRDGKHKVHFCVGAPLGTEQGFEAGEVEGQLEAGDRMLMLTDGIPEIALPNGNVIGMRRVAQVYERTREQPVQDAAGALVAFADQSTAGQRQLDDWTFTILQWG